MESAQAALHARPAREIHEAGFDGEFGRNHRRRFVATAVTDGSTVRAGFGNTCALRAPTVFSARMKSTSAQKTRFWLTPNTVRGVVCLSVPKTRLARAT